MDVTLLTAVGAPWESAVVATLAGTPGAHVVRRCADLADLLAASDAGLAGTAVVSADLRGLDRTAVGALRSAGVTVVGVHAPGDEQQETFLRRIGITVVLASDALQDEWTTGLAEAARETPTQPALTPPEGLDPLAELDPLPRAEGRVVAVWGPTGAPGRTFVATQLAGVLAQEGRRVVIVDADTYGASVAQVLALLDEAAGLAAAVRQSNLGRLDIVALATLAPEARPGLRVLTGLPQPERWPELAPEALRQVLLVARELADVVLVDCGFSLEEDEDLTYDTRAPQRNGATLAVLSEADVVLAVGRADPVGLGRLVRALDQLKDRGIVPRVVANRVRAAAVGTRPEERVRDVLARFAGVEALTCVPDDPEAVDSAVLEGRLLVEAAPRSEAVRALRSLGVEARLLSAETAPRGRRRGGR